MSPIRAAGCVLGAIAGILAIAVQHYNTTPSCPSCSATTLGGLPSVWLAVAGGLLLVLSLMSFGGFRLTFYAAAVLGVMVLAADLALRGSYPADEWELIAGLSLLAILADLVAARPARALSEKDSPLNLPVFG